MRILTISTKRAFPNLKIGIDLIRKANFQELFDSDLKDIINKKLGLIFYKDENYVLFFYAKNALNTPYELFLNCFPTNNNFTHSIDELETKYRNTFFKGIESSQFSIKEFGEKNNIQLLRIYSYQHIGANELNYLEYKTTYPQTHWHIYGVDRNTIDNSVISNHNENYFLNTFYEFFIEMYAELFELDSSSIDYNTHSIVLRKKKLSLNIDSIDKNIISNILIKWKEKWKEIVSCFTTFEVSNQERFVIHTECEILNNLNKLIENNKMIFSSDSKKRLFWLAKKIKKQAEIKDSKSKYYWRSIHLGINGSIGFTHNFENETSTLRIAPRTFATLERIGCLDRFYFCFKNRKKDLSNFEISEISKIQQELFSIIESKILQKKQ